MKMRNWIGAAAMMLLLAGCNEKGGNSSAGGASGGEPIAAVPAPNGGDWTQIVSQSPEGGYLMGNPGAAVKLVEYASYTCPHCAEFSEAATTILQNEYVKSGRVSWEFRPFMLFPTDPGISLLVRCQGAPASFLLAEQLYANQKEWVGRLQSLSEAQQAQFQGLPPQQRMGALVRAAGLDQFFRQRGMPESKVGTCLANQAELEKLLAITDRGSKEFNVTGTPTFFINGEKVEDAASWIALEPALRQAVGG
jgi:protein-disulfide isomerase